MIESLELCSGGAGQSRCVPQIGWREPLCRAVLSIDSYDIVFRSCHNISLFELSRNGLGIVVVVVLIVVSRSYFLGRRSSFFRTDNDCVL